MIARPDKYEPPPLSNRLQDHDGPSRLGRHATLSSSLPRWPLVEVIIHRTAFILHQNSLWTITTVAESMDWIFPGCGPSLALVHWPHQVESHQPVHCPYTSLAPYIYHPAHSSPHMFVAPPTPYTNMTTMFQPESMLSLPMVARQPESSAGRSVTCSSRASRCLNICL